MARTIRRSGKGARRSSRAGAGRARVASARRQTGSLLDTAMRMLPVSDETLHRLVVGTLVALAAVALVALAGAIGVPGMIEARVAALASASGFKVRRVEVRGVTRMNEMVIYQRVLGQRDQAMSRLDLAALRADLLTLPWVKDARVSRQLPDTLVVDVVERVPRAVIQNRDGFTLIDQSGHPLEPVPAERARGMLILRGVGVSDHIAELDRLLDAAPALKGQVGEAEWVGHRRWNLTFRTHQMLALPEGEDESAAALLGFAKMDGVDRLLGGKVAAFDMRVAGRVYLRIPGHADAIAAQAKAAAVARAAAAAQQHD